MATATRDAPKPLMGRPYAIVEATEQHIEMLAPRLRLLDCLELTANGSSAIDHLRRCYRGAVMRKTAFVEAEIAAAWGLHCGTLLSGEGHPWLMTAPPIERAPIAFVKEARREVERMLDVRPRLINYVLASYGGAIRLLSVLGFTIGEPEPLGPNRVMFRRFEMVKS